MEHDVRGENHLPRSRVTDTRLVVASVATVELLVVIDSGYRRGYLDKVWSIVGVQALVGNHISNVAM